MDEDQVRALLQASHTIAVVGMSDKEERDSNIVGAYLLSKGYRVIPVNPVVPEILGQKSYPSLREIPGEVRIDIVDVFRKSDAVPGIVDEVLELPHPPRAVWLQQGVTDDRSGERVRSKGIGFVQDDCLMVQHRHLFP